MTVQASPAITLARAARTEVEIGGKHFGVWTVQDMDALIDDFVEWQKAAPHTSQRCPFGASLWPSARAFAGELLGTDPLVKMPSLALELGSGVGFVSCMMAIAGAAHVVASDFEPAYAAFVARNAAEANVSGQVNFSVLDWYDESTWEPHRGRYPLVVACDVLYENEHLGALPRVARACVTSDGMFCVADPGRVRLDAARQELTRWFSKVEERLVSAPAILDDRVRGLVNASEKSRTDVHILLCRP